MQDHLQTTLIFPNALTENCTPNSLRQKPRKTLPTRPWRSLPKHANDKKMRGASMRRSATKRPRPKQFSTTAQKNTLEKAEALETHVKGGISGDQRGRLLQDAPRPPGRSAETLERAFSDRSAGKKEAETSTRALKFAMFMWSREHTRTTKCPLFLSKHVRRI